MGLQVAMVHPPTCPAPSCRRPFDPQSTSALTLPASAIVPTSPSSHLLSSLSTPLPLQYSLDPQLCEDILRRAHDERGHQVARLQREMALLTDDTTAVQVGMGGRLENATKGGMTMDVDPLCATAGVSSGD